MKLKYKYLIGLIFTSIILLYIAFGNILLFGYGYNSYYKGQEIKGNNIMKYALNDIKSNQKEYYYQYSVQNTKLGGFDEGIWALENAYELDSVEILPYYSWVLLYYYHDFEKSLIFLTRYDNLTPNFSDAPMGEDIHYLKGLALMNLKKHEEALTEFNININETLEKSDSSWVNVYTHINKGICLFSLSNYEKAILEYEKAITIYDDCSEAYYFMGLAQKKIGLLESACFNLNKSKSLLLNGYKSSDKYVELFHEIYLTQVQDSISLYCE